MGKTLLTTAEEKGRTSHALPDFFLLLFFRFFANLYVGMEWQHPMIHLLTTDYPTTPQKNHSLIPPVQFGEGKGKWALCMNKMQNLLLLNHDTSVQSLHASWLDVAQPQNNRAVHTPRSCKWEWKTKGSRWKSSRKGGSETAQAMDSAH